MITASLVKELREKSGAGMLDCKKALEACNGNIDEAMDWLREKGISKAAKKADRIAAEGLAAILVRGNEAAIVEVNSETDFVAKNDEFKSLVSAILEGVISSNATTVEEALALEVEGSTIQDLIVNKTAKIGEKLSLRRFVKVTKQDNEVFGEYIHMGGRIAVLTVLADTTDEVAKDVAMHAAAMRPSYVRRSEVPSEEIEKETAILKEQIINEGKPAEMADKIVVGKINKYYTEICLEEQIFVKSEDKSSVGKFVKDNGGSIVSMIRYEVGEGMEKRQDNFAEEVMNQVNGAN